MQEFNEYSLEDFRLTTDTILSEGMTFSEVADEVDKNEVSYFYISMNPDDVLQAIEDEQEIANLLDLRLINIKPLGVFIATY